VKKHNGSEKLFSYLHESMSVGSWYRERFEKMIKVIGRETADKMVLKGKGWAFYSYRCIHIAKWAGIFKYKAFVNYMLDVEDAETECRKLYESREGGYKVLDAFQRGVSPCCASVAA